MRFKNGYQAIGLLLLSVFFLYGSLQAAQFQVQRPGKLNIPRNIKKVFIDPGSINEAADKLGLKSEVVLTLKRRLNEMGRFEVIVGPPRDIDPNRETIAIIQGDVISGGEIDQGQLTEKAECRGGVSGLVGAGTAGSTSNQGITFSRRGMLCKLPTMESRLVESGLSAGLSLLGVQEFPRYDEVIRVYKFKNLSLFAQVNLSFTQIGTQRETLTIRSDAASFSRHAVAPGSYHNVRESGDNAPLIWLWFRITPIAPVIIREIGVVRATNPDSFPAQWYDIVAPDVRDIDPNEKKAVLSKLVNKSLDQFIQTISPYQVVIETELASGGNSAAQKMIAAGRYLEAREILGRPSNADDLYNLGLTYEAGAVTIEDYEDALRFYSDALAKQPNSRLFAQGIGRMELQLRVYRNVSRKVVN
ncbi:MAG: tetratricopeptide repeat protein [bacterium]